MANLSNQPHLSVVIPTLGRPILVQTLQSLVRCTGFEELEVLVCGRLHDKEVHAAVTQLASLHPNIRHLEVSFPVGDSSEKKNAGWRGARSDLVAFLDDDVVVARDWPLRMREPFAKADTAVVSGPSLVPPEVGLFARLAGLALASPAAGYVAARYRVAGSAPVAIGWSKIIGCNMCYRRNVLETLGGFDPAFWPGEEMIAAFRVQQGGSRLLFYAAAWVYHYPRQSFRRFWRQIHGYGATRVRLCRGGVEIEPTTFVPALWVLSLVALGSASLFSTWACWLLILDLSLYAAVVAAITLIMVRESRRLSDLLLLLVIPVMHLSYGLGCWSEFLRPDKDLSERPVGAS
jgi:cellulose synthase/poly-beta-1,6-N-acetylglucosamine synthase-like glycosyltransferase